MSPNMLCGLQYFMKSCAIALLIQHSPSALTVKSVKIGHQAAYTVYRRETTNIILASVSDSLSNPCISMLIKALSLV